MAPYVLPMDAPFKGFIVLLPWNNGESQRGRETALTLVKTWYKVMKKMRWCCILYSNFGESATSLQFRGHRIIEESVVVTIIVLPDDYGIPSFCFVVFCFDDEMSPLRL